MSGRLVRVLAVILLFAGAACSRRAQPNRTAPPLAGDAVWFADGIGAKDGAVEETLAEFHCAAVFLPARRLARAASGWSGSDLPAPVRPLSRVPIVLVVEAEGDPLKGMDEKQSRGFGQVLAREISAALARAPAFGRVRGIHLDVPFSGATAQAHAAALREARARLSHLFGRGKETAAAPVRQLPLTLSMRKGAPSDEKEQKAVRALVSRSDGVVAFVFGDDSGADPAFVDSLGRPWWAGYGSATKGVLRRATGEPGTSVPESALDALTDDSRIEVLHELPWNEERGWEYTLRATRSVAVPGAALSTGDSVVFTQPSIADLLARFRADTSRRHFSRGRVVVFGGEADAGRLFPVAALADVIAGRRPVPELRAWVEADVSRSVRVGAENSSPHASVVSRVENWVEVDLSPARVSDVELGGFDRWEAYDERGRSVSPGRATRVRLFETLVAPFERLEPARLRVRGKLPTRCCATRTRLASASGGEGATEWEPPGGAANAGARPTPSP